MVDWTSKPVDSHVTTVAQVISLVALGFFFYDLILALPFDCSIIFGKRRRRWPQVAYFGCKVSYIGYAAVMMLLNYAQHRIDCQTAMYMLEMLMGFVALTSSALLACRTVVVYYGSARTAVTVVLVVLWAGVAAAWMQGVSDVTAQWLVSAAQPWNDGACAPVELKDTYYVKYVITIIFDAVVLGLTVLGILRLRGTSHIGRVLIRQGVIFFVLTFLANLVITILTALHLSPTMSLLFAMPQSTVCTICACRLYFELAEESKYTSSQDRQPSGVDELHRDPDSQVNSEGYIGKAYMYGRRPSNGLTSTSSPMSMMQERQVTASAPARTGEPMWDDDIEKQTRQSPPARFSSPEMSDLARASAPNGQESAHDKSSGDVSSGHRSSPRGILAQLQPEQKTLGRSASVEANDSARSANGQSSSMPITAAALRAHDEEEDYRTPRTELERWYTSSDERP